jgi:GTP cyclohydrolase I
MKERDLSLIVAEMLQLIDSDHTRPGLERTPERFAQFLQEFTKKQDFKMTTFDNEGYDEMIIETAIPFYSLCEHHLVPFFGTGTIAYIPNDKIVGLSKLGRVLDFFSSRLQNQERITTQIADYLQETLSPKGVGVILTARHLCMEMRGVKKPGTLTTTSSLRGNFKSDPRTRAEFFSINQAPRP